MPLGNRLSAARRRSRWGSYQSKLNSRTRMTPKAVAILLKGVERLGTEVDEPEGSRYIYVSDTLTKNIIRSLETFEDNLLAILTELENTASLPPASSRAASMDLGMLEAVKAIRRKLYPDNA